MFRERLEEMGLTISINIMRTLLNVTNFLGATRALFTIINGEGEKTVYPNISPTIHTDQSARHGTTHLHFAG
jgi:hypothetical protein